MREEDIIASVERNQEEILISYERTPIIRGRIDQLVKADVYEAIDKHPAIPSDVRGWLKTAYDTRIKQGGGSTHLDRFNIGADIEGLLAM